MSLNKFVTRRRRNETGHAIDAEGESQAKKPNTEKSSATSSVSKDDGGKEKDTITHSSLTKTYSSSGPDRQFNWTKIKAENLDLDNVQLYSKTEADCILQELEKTVVYNSGQLAKVQMFGKWVDIPRKQTAYGEEGLSYTFSGNTVPARPWITPLLKIRDHITKVTGFCFNFVLVNRYKDGTDYMGEHKDDEKDLLATHPIASLSLGQSRDFYFKHQDCRGKKASRTDLTPVKLVLEHGTLLLMNPPTNRYWYHALPKRKRLSCVRINLTFRMMNRAVCKPVKAPD